MPLTTVQSGMMDSVAQYNGFKNRIINGGMQIDQRNAGASVTPFNGQYLVDRWYGYQNNGSKYSAQQTTTAPTGFINSLRATSLAASSVAATDVYTLSQAIEGLNVADLAWGTASAHTVTLSFWVRSSLTGTFGGVLVNSGFSRSYPFTYTISAANTFEFKTVTIPGDTTGTWLTTNGIGINIHFGLGIGSTYSGTAGAWAAAGFYGATGVTSIIATSGATLFITGVQLEKGVTATSFDYRPYTTELQLCQRYLPAFNSTSTTHSLGAAYAAATTVAVATLTFPVQARVAPTGISSTAASTMQFGAAAGAFVGSAVAIGANSGTLGCDVNLTISGATAGQGGKFSFNNATGQLLFTGCEL